jgi:hypothetical protein
MKIYFFFPYRRISGVPILFANLAEYISENYDWVDVNIIDYVDGIININCKNKRINRIFFEDSKMLKLSADGILIMQSIRPYAIRPELLIDDNMKILFWNLHPDNLIMSNIFKSSSLNFALNKFRFEEENVLKNFLKKCIEKQGIVFMDEPNSDKTSQSHGLKFDPVFLPISIKETNLQMDFTRPVKINSLVFSYIGRIDNFKFYPLKKLLSALELVKNSLNIEQIIFLVCGDGNEKIELEKFANDIKSFKIQFVGELQNSKISEFLIKNNVDINFAMGGAALDSAQLGIPTVLLDYSWKEMKSFPKYQWIFQQIKYSLGRELQDNMLQDSNVFSLNFLIKEYLEQHILLREKTKKYFLDNYSINKISAELVRLVGLVNLNFGDIKNFAKRNIFRRIYNYKKYKISK